MVAFKKEKAVCFAKECKRVNCKKKYIKLLGEAQFHGARRMNDRLGWCWVVVLTIFFVTSVIVLLQNIMRYIDKPTYLIKLSSVSGTTSFPAVVVCPEIMYPDHRQEALLDDLKYLPGTNRTYVKSILYQLAAFYSVDVPYQTHELGVLQKLLDHNNVSVRATAERLTASCEEILLECRWLSLTVKCKELFRMELTGDGFCCVFNGRSLNREFGQKGAHREIHNKQIRLTDKVGPFTGLLALVNQSQTHNDLDLSYKWVTLQHGQRYVEIPMNGTAISPGYEHWFGYKTRGFRIADSSFKDLSLDLRRCRMFSEEPLQFFPVYGRTYCQVECEMLHTRRRCGCIRPNHPRPPGFRHCRAQDLDCARHASVSFSAEFCNCPRTCDVDTPVTKVYSFELIPYSSSYDPMYIHGDFQKRSVLRVFIDGFRRKQFAQKNYFTLLDLYSQSGGIFSLYFGCSILTLLEISILLFHGLREIYRKFHKRRPSKEVTKFQHSLIKSTLSPTTTIYRDGILISFQQDNLEVPLKKLKRNNKELLFLPKKK